MLLKHFVTILAIGGIAAGAFFYRDPLSTIYSKGKQKVKDKKTKLTKDPEKTQKIGPPPEQKTPTKNNESAAPERIPRFYDSTATPITPRIPEHYTPANLSYIVPQGHHHTTAPRPRTTRPRRSSKSRDTPRTRYEKRKYGIDRQLTRTAREKTPSRRTINERKHIEAEKARKIFDSRSISNW